MLEKIKQWFLVMFILSQLGNFQIDYVDALAAVKRYEDKGYESMTIL